ncbi:MAG TPA: hypothetical protein VEA69_25560 [Tepidisphaeraceae bacterium]|nr:hypothetical protein [Tepidisphaeraceae bacterium]
MRAFWVADLTAAGEVRLMQEYRYAHLERIPGAIDLIATFANYLWRSPEGFEARLPGSHLSVRWVACSETSGLATLREQGGSGEAATLVSVSVLVCGREPADDAATLGPVQTHLLRELHDTGVEPAFDLVAIEQRPLVASLNFALPEGAEDRVRYALADRCFAAAFFRKAGLA